MRVNDCSQSSEKSGKKGMTFNSIDPWKGIAIVLTNLLPSSAK